jgi:hypothetical protein
VTVQSSALHGLRVNNNQLQPENAMKNNIIKMIATAMIVGGGLLPIVSQAAVPAAMLEKSATYALNNKVHAFRLPTTDSNGVLRYYDVDVQLNVNANGTITTATITKSVSSPTVGTVNVVPGTYLETGTTDKCTVTNITLPNGRIQSFFKCNNGTALFEISVATGTISAGHPFQTELTGQGVNLKSDVNTYSWGFITNGALNLGTCGAYSASTAYPIGVKTNGNQLIVSVFRFGTAIKAPAFQCSNALTKQ